MKAVKNHEQVLTEVSTKKLLDFVDFLRHNEYSDKAISDYRASVSILLNLLESCGANENRMSKDTIG